MNRDIVELREVIQKLVPLLAGRGLTVTQRGSQAYVATNPTTKQPERVNIPSIPDNAKPDFVRAIQGFIDHEVAHVLYTDWHYYGGEGGVSAADLGKREVKKFLNIHNIVEDTMIERMMIRDFPGSGRNLTDTRKYFLSRITAEALKTAKNAKEEFVYLLVPTMRALAGHVEMQEFMDDGKYWENEFVAEVVNNLTPATLDLLKRCTTTKETLEISKELFAIVYPPAPPAPPAPPPPPPPAPEPEEDEEDSKSEDKPDEKAGEGDGDGERDHDDAEGKEEGKPEAGAEPEDSDEDSADETEGGSADEKDDDAEEDPTAAKAGAPGEEESDDDGDEEAAGSGLGSGGNDEEGDEDESADGDDGDEDGDGEDGSAGMRTEGDEGGGVGEINGDDSESEGGGGVGNQEAKSIFDYEDDAFDEADMSSQIAILISDEAVAAMDPKQYMVFTREFDRIEHIKPPERMASTWVPRMEGEVMSLTGKMQKDIERIMASQSHVVRTPGHRRGKLHAPSLFRVMQGDPRVFTQKQEHISKDTAVTLLLDNSGSMHGEKMKLGTLSSYALSVTLDRVKIAHEVLGFTSGGYYDVPHSLREAMNEDMAASGVRYDRLEPIMMPIYKDFDERLNALVKARFAYMMYAQDGLAGNIDGESLEYAAMRLIKRPEKRKVMIVLSDGQPAGSIKSGPHLSYMVRHLESIGIECIGIGIMDASVKKYYPKHVVLKDVNQLPFEVMAEIKKLLA